MFNVIKIHDDLQLVKEVRFSGLEVAEDFAKREGATKIVDTETGETVWPKPQAPKAPIYIRRRWMNRRAPASSGWIYRIDGSGVKRPIPDNDGGFRELEIDYEGYTLAQCKNIALRLAKEQGRKVEMDLMTPEYVEVTYRNLGW